MEFLSLDLERGLNFNFLFKRKKVFIIHGHDEPNLEKLQIILYSLNLIPVTISQDYTLSSHAIIEKFEILGRKCKYAIAICTPDDKIIKKGNAYLQPRPNVIYEIGWFCARLGRGRVLTIVKEGTEIFSDFQGVLQIRFKQNIKECYENLFMTLKKQYII